MAASAWIVSFTVLVIAVCLSFFNYHLRHLDVNKLGLIDSSSRLVDAWNDIIKKQGNGGSGFKKIAVGVNGDVDLILQGTELFTKLNPESSNSTENKAQDHAVIASIEELNEIFTLFLSKGGGGERFFSNFDDFQKIIEVTDSLASIKKFVGGNAALIAQKFLELNSDTKVLVGLPIGPVLDSLLNPSLQRIKSETTSLMMDEYHVVLEYSRDEIWNGHKAPASSRFIFSHDISNSHMKCFKHFVASLPQFSPDLVVISGLHMMEGIDWKERLNDIVEDFRTIPKSAVIHVELASMASSNFVGSLIQNILPQVHSIGLNEQELWLLCHSLGDERCSKSLQPDIPVTIDVAIEMIKFLFQHLHKVHDNKLSRIHFHTLSFHIIATNHKSPWSNQLVAVSAGARQAALQACGGDIGPDRVDMGVQNTGPVHEWTTTEGVSFHMTSSLICRRPLKTVGLGDAISASGLLYSDYL